MIFLHCFTHVDHLGCSKILANTNNVLVNNFILIPISLYLLRLLRVPSIKLTKESNNLRFQNTSKKNKNLLNLVPISELQVPF